MRVELATSQTALFIFLAEPRRSDFEEGFIGKPVLTGGFRRGGGGWQERLAVVANGWAGTLAAKGL